MSVGAPYTQNAESGSLRLALDKRIFEPFPPEIAWRDIQLFKKSEFHVTLLHAKGSPEFFSISIGAITDFFTAFVSKSPITFVSFIDDFRYVEEEDKKTILIRCTVSNIERLFAELNSVFDTHLPVQPTHITLYSLEKTVGIHVNDVEAMERLPRIDLPGLEMALKRTAQL